MRNNLRSAADDIESIFARIDKDGKGVFSNLEFMNALRKLGIGIKINEID